MIYRAIGLMSGSSLDGLDIVFAEFHHSSSGWTFSITAADCYPYTPGWSERLRTATELNARDYLLLHTDFGRYLGEAVNRFIEEHKLHFQVALVASHGHTTFHLPARGMTGQLGDGATLAAVTGLPVVSDLRALDVALGGQGAPIVPIGETLLLNEYDRFLNLGGIANVSVKKEEGYIAYDVCAANRVLNLIAGEAELEYDAGGALAATGTVHGELLARLDAFDYYDQPYPKSLANDFGTDTVYPLVRSFGLTPADALRTYVEHTARQVARALTDDGRPTTDDGQLTTGNPHRLLVTGGGAFNTFLVDRLRDLLEPAGVEVVVPEASLVQYKEALIMAFIGVLRWRQEYTVLPSVTGASRPSIGGALWIGQE